MIATRMAAVLAAAVLAAGCGGEDRTLDTRTPVRLTAEQRNAVLVEMRGMLGSVNAILVAAQHADSSAVREAALKSGSASAADPALERLLPAQWLQIAMATHHGFDTLAASAGRGRDSVVSRLGAVTGNCVACHAMYRLPVR